MKSVVGLIDRYGDERSCEKHLQSILWRDSEYCPHCGNVKIYHCAGGRRFRCASCKKDFSIKTGTIFHDSKISLRKWFFAIHMVTTHKKSMSSYQLARDLPVTQKTAYYMLHRIRESVRNEDFIVSFVGTVEIDDTYIGGKERNKHSSKRVGNTQGRSVKTKEPVFGMVERGSGQVKAERVSRVDRETIEKRLLSYVNIGSRVISDEWKAYNRLGDLYDHDSVNHSRHEYVRGEIHTNTIEGFWAILKRSIYGIHHFVSAKHLQRYINEQIFRYNNRGDHVNMFNMILERVGGKKLSYKELTG